MHYKTMILKLLQERPQMHEQLRQKRTLLSAVEQYARELRTSHQAWQQLLFQIRPSSPKQRIASEALELALKEMENRLPSESPQSGDDAMVLEAAMLFVRRPTSRG